MGNAFMRNELPIPKRTNSVCTIDDDFFFIIRSVRLVEVQGITIIGLENIQVPIPTEVSVQLMLETVKLHGNLIGSFILVDGRGMKITDTPLTRSMYKFYKP